MFPARAARADAYKVDPVHSFALFSIHHFNAGNVWGRFNEPAGKIFCLAEAPSADVAIAVHREAHGLLPDEIIEVEGKDVEGFLGTAEEVPRGRTPPGM